MKIGFFKLKKFLTFALLLAFRNFNALFIVETDVSEVSVGAVLGQNGTEGNVQLIYFASKPMKKPNGTILTVSGRRLPLNYLFEGFLIMLFF